MSQKDQNYPSVSSEPLNADTRSWKVNQYSKVTHSTEVNHAFRDTHEASVNPMVSVSQYNQVNQTYLVISLILSESCGASYPNCPNESQEKKLPNWD